MKNPKKIANAGTYDNTAAIKSFTDATTNALDKYPYAATLAKVGDPATETGLYAALKSSGKTDTEKAIIKNDINVLHDLVMLYLDTESATHKYVTTYVLSVNVGYSKTLTDYKDGTYQFPQNVYFSVLTTGGLFKDTSVNKVFTTCPAGTSCTTQNNCTPICNFPNSNTKAAKPSLAFMDNFDAIYKVISDEIGTVPPPQPQGTTSFGAYFDVGTFSHGGWFAGGSDLGNINLTCGGKMKPTDAIGICVPKVGIGGCPERQIIIEDLATKFMNGAKSVGVSTIYFAFSQLSEVDYLIKALETPDDPTFYQKTGPTAINPFAEEIYWDHLGPVLEKIVEVGIDNKMQMILSFGGEFAAPKHFIFPTGDTLTSLIQGLKKFKFTGIDFDIEMGNDKTVLLDKFADLNTFCQAIKAAGLTTTLTTDMPNIFPSEWSTNKSFHTTFDYLNVMAYAGGGTDALQYLKNTVGSRMTGKYSFEDMGIKYANIHIGVQDECTYGGSPQGIFAANALHTYTKDKGFGQPFIWLGENSKGRFCPAFDKSDPPLASYPTFYNQFDKDFYTQYKINNNL